MRCCLGTHVELLDGLDGEGTEEDLAEEFNLRGDDVCSKEERRVGEVDKILRVSILGDGRASIKQLHSHPDSSARVQSSVDLL